MTPIRVRGRRYAQPLGSKSGSKKKGQSGASSPSVSSNSTAAPSASSDGIPSNHEMEIKRQRISKPKAVRDAPPKIPPKLEALPKEILDQIFGYCLEINLPRASLALGQAFGVRVYENLTIQAFTPTLSPRRLGKYRATSCALTHAEWLRRQSQIISCKWFSRRFLLHCASLYFKQIMYYHEWPSVGESVDEENRAAFDRLMDSIDNDEENDSILDTTVVKSHCDGIEMLRKWSIDGSQVAQKYADSAELEWIETWKFPALSRPWDARCVPEMLCQTPFNPSKLDKLRVVADLYSPLGDVFSERLNLAVGEAISAGNGEALSLFLRLGGCSAAHTIHDDKECNTAGLDRQHYVSATFGEGEMLARLIEFDKGRNLPKDDPRITAWGLEAEKNPSTAELGTKVLKMMT
jgi:hypothetical protein